MHPDVKLKSIEFVKGNDWYLSGVKVTLSNQESSGLILKEHQDG